MDEIEKILRESRTIAVVGLSGKPDRPSHGVAAYMQRAGYKIIPVNPVETEVLGEKSYPTLKDVPVPVDIVDIFRKPDALPALVAESIAIKARCVWFQEGLRDDASAEKARKSGLVVIQDLCILKEHAQRNL